MSVVPVSTQSYVKSSAEPSEEQKLICEQLLRKMKHPPVTPVLYYREGYVDEQMDYMRWR